jgi:hypothetical protein
MHVRMSAGRWCMRAPRRQVRTCCVRTSVRAVCTLLYAKRSKRDLLTTCELECSDRDGQSRDMVAARQRTQGQAGDHIVHAGHEGGRPVYASIL